MYWSISHRLVRVTQLKSHSGMTTAEWSAMKTEPPSQVSLISCKKECRSIYKEPVFYPTVPAVFVLPVDTNGVEYDTSVLFDAFHTVPMVVGFIEFSGPVVVLMKPKHSPLEFRFSA